MKVVALQCSFWNLFELHHKVLLLRRLRLNIFLITCFSFCFVCSSQTHEKGALGAQIKLLEIGQVSLQEHCGHACCIHPGFPSHQFFLDLAM